MFIKSIEKDNELFQLTHPQKRVWYIEEIQPDTSVGNIGGTIRIKGEVNTKLLCQSINNLIRTNAALRLNLTEINGEVFQYVKEYEEIEIEYFDFSLYEEAEMELEKWVQCECTKPFKIKNSDLYYFCIFKISDSDYGYFAKFHHIICDGWSVNLMTNQICDTYMKLFHGEDIDTDLKGTYIDYVKNEQGYLKSEKFIKNGHFWNDKFEDVESNFINYNSNSLKGMRKTYELDESLSIRIKEFAAQNRFSINTFFVSLMILYISKTTPQKDIIIGTPVLNRSGKKEKTYLVCLPVLCH